jgi:4-hydroxybenzoyl-CoA thioesterase
MAFVLPTKILFRDCDPAGIVFYPRYFEMINNLVEEWFEQRVGLPFAEMHGPDNSGAPTVTISAKFEAPSRLGDRVDFILEVTKLGRSSLGIAVTAKAGEETRLTAEAVLVHTDKTTGRPRPWPERLRANMAQDMRED